MLFNSYLFLLVFLPVTLLIYYLAGRYLVRIQPYVLLAANLIFYLSAGIGYLALLLLMTTVTFLAGRLVSGATHRRWGLWLILSNLLILLVFKYANWLAGPLSGGLVSIALPLGISFYTFNLVSYGLDVYRRLMPPETSYLTFLSRIAFFPTILSGPLTRYRDLSSTPSPASEDGQSSLIELGLFNLCVGLAKKVLIADAVAALINPLWADTAALGVIGAWVAVVGYALQLYFDFSGYTDMATGIAYLLGYQLPQNFNAPYAARNITDFWQRWHMTLSSWFRDYLFLPLSRSLLRRYAAHPDSVRTASLVLTMTLTGLWHGVNWPFILWGAYHGLMLAVHAQTRTWRWKALPVPVARGVTLLAVLMGWVMFRSPSLDIAAQVYKSMLGLNGLGLQVLERSGGSLRYSDLLTLAVVFLLTQIGRDTYTLYPRRQWVYAFTLAVLLVVSLAFIDQTRTFLYFQF